MGIAGGLVRTGARAIGPPRPNLPAAAARGLGRRLRAGASTSSATNEARAGEDDGDAPHVPVLMRQVLDAFDGRSLRCYLDGTMGAGGHASAIIRAHPELRTFVGFDVDPLAHSIARPRLEAAATESCASTSGRDGESPHRRRRRRCASTRCSPTFGTCASDWRSSTSPTGASTRY